MHELEKRMVIWIRIFFFILRQKIIISNALITLNLELHRSINTSSLLSLFSAIHLIWCRRKWLAWWGKGCYDNRSRGRSLSGPHADCSHSSCPPWRPWSKRRDHYHNNCSQKMTSLCKRSLSAYLKHFSKCVTLNI